MRGQDFSIEPCASSLPARKPIAERTAAALEALGHEVLVAPLMRIEPVAADLAGTWSAIVITSANALQAVPATADGVKPLPVFAVGDRSAEAARGRDLPR